MRHFRGLLKQDFRLYTCPKTKHLKFNYWNKSIKLHKRKLTRGPSLTFKFSWGSRHVLPWFPWANCFIHLIIFIFLGVCSFFVSSPDRYSAVCLTRVGGAYLEHISLTLAANVLDLRDLSKSESMCYILELVHHSLKACNKRHKRCLCAQAWKERMLQEGNTEKGRGPIYRWTLIDVWQLVIEHLRGQCIVEVPAVNMESVISWLNPWILWLPD